MGCFSRFTGNALVLVTGLVSSVLATHGVKTTWKQTIGSDKLDQVNSIIQTSDGGYVLTGCQENATTGRNALIVCKLNGSGQVRWSKVIGSADIDAAGYSVEECSQGGYIVAGFIRTETTGDDAVLIKLSPEGSQQWTRYESTAQDERAYSVAKTDDGGYLITGSTKNLGSGNVDPFVSKYDGNGVKKWMRNYGSWAWDVAFQITPTSNGNFMLVGETRVSPLKELDVFAVKINSNGDKIWSKTYGSEMDESGYSIQNCSDGGYIIAGRTFSDSGYGEDDAYIIKTDSLGNALWTKRYGGACSDVVYSVRQDSDGGYLLSGNTSSVGSDRINAYLLKIDAVGNLIWRETIPGTVNIGSAFQPTSDGGCIIAVNSPSRNGDIEVIKVVYTEIQKRPWNGVGQLFTCVDSLSQIGFGGFKKTYWEINKFERLLQSVTPGCGAISKIMTPGFNICRDTGVVKVSLNAGFPTEYGFNWQDHNQLEIALLDDRNNELYTLQFKPNKPIDIGKTIDLKLFKDATTLVASARTDRVAPHGAGSKMVKLTMDVSNNGQISVMYDAADGNGLLKYIDTPENSYRVFKRLKLTYKTGTAGDGNNFVTIDNLLVYESKE